MTFRHKNPPSRGNRCLINALINVQVGLTWPHCLKKTLQCYEQLRQALLMHCVVVVNRDVSHVGFLYVNLSVCVVPMQDNMAAN